MKKGILVGGMQSISLLLSGAFSVWAILHWELEGWSAAFCYLPVLILITMVSTCSFISMENIINPKAFLHGFTVSSMAVIVLGIGAWWLSDLPMISPDAPNWRVFVIASPFLSYLLMNFRKKLRQYTNKD